VTAVPNPTQSQHANPVLLVDLNNFARYPSMAIGYLAASLRQAGLGVQVFAPLMIGVSGVVREAPPPPWGALLAQANHWIATSPSETVRAWRERLAGPNRSAINRHAAHVVDAFARELDAVRPLAVLVSTYLMYREVCVAIAAHCQRRSIPLLLGGPYFAQEETAHDWARIKGVTAVSAGEVDDKVPDIVRRLIAGQPLTGFDGLITANDLGAVSGTIAPPLLDLDRVAVPDYSDYPWHLYPNRIVPVITGRGCGWGHCTFCSDVTSTAGRTFRSRGVASVLEEIRSHRANYDARHFVFTDLKLNSNLTVWRALHMHLQFAAPESQWIGAVHVGSERDNGLSRDDLRAAAASGCVRLTTGLETGSQKIATLMRKGTRIDAISQFLHEALDAGISTRCTMVIGYPGETAEDVDSSTRFLEQHTSVIERVAINRLQVIAGTRLHQALKERPDRFDRIRILGEVPAQAQVDHHNDTVASAAHRRAVMRLYAISHRINSKSLMPRARAFEGVM